MAFEMDVLVDDDLKPWPHFRRWCRDVLNLVVDHVPEYAGIRKTWTVTIRLANNRTVQTLNRKFRKKNKATNVLSFPNTDDGFDVRWHVGDIILAQGVILAEAKTLKRLPANHARHLVLHGLLHLLGYDHETPRDAKRMEKLETKLLAMLKIPDPYAE